VVHALPSSLAGEVRAETIVRRRLKAVAASYDVALIDNSAQGDARTAIPRKLSRPRHWPPTQTGEGVG
jgi:hypothetical protein